jgi:hypothetical protein
MDTNSLELHHIDGTRSQRDSSTDSTDSRTEIQNSEPRKTHDTGRIRIRSSWKTIPWLLEIASWIASLLFFVAIIIVLKVFEGRSLPNLPLNVSLNAIVGLLATFGEILFMVPVASAIGQIKWFRALKKRPMDEFRLVDEASRGPWGGFLLLVKTKGG